MSLAALHRMTKLKINSDVDNVLLEWTLILELLASGSLLYCVPVLIGSINAGSSSNSSTQFFSSFFQDDPYVSLPDVVVSSVATEAARFLQSEGISPSSDLATRTVRDVVKKVAEHLGVLSWETPGNEQPSGAAQRTVHEEERLKKALFETCTGKVMSCIEAAVGDGLDEVRSCSLYKVSKHH